MVALTPASGEPRRSAPLEPVPAMWKFLCALAVLLGHNLVTWKALRPGSDAIRLSFDLLQFFSPYHFFLFSGYFAASALKDSSRGIVGFATGRGLRIYILVVCATAWAAAVRFALFPGGTSPESAGIWPLGLWAGPLDPSLVARHLSPLGMVDSTRVNYAVWYLYQELRIVLLFPLFRWILRQGPNLRWGAVALLFLAAAALEYRFWSLFPLFRTSPFQSLSYGGYFLAGACLREEFRVGGRLAPGRVPAWRLLVPGALLAALIPLGISLPVKNPPILLVPILLGQILCFAGLRSTVSGLRLPGFLERATNWSVGIYVVHPPVHMVAASLAVAQGSDLPLWIGMGLSILLGGAFHRWIERPSVALVRRIQGT